MSLAYDLAERDESVDGSPNADEEAERWVLGCLLLEPERMPLIAALVEPADFYRPAHAVIFDAMLALARAGTAIDIVTLADELKQRERLKTVGGTQYLGELTESIATAAHIEQHAKLVAELAQVRRGLDVAARLASAKSRRATPEELGRAAVALTAAATRKSDAQLTQIGEQVYRAVERVEESRETGRTLGLKTGFVDIDRLLGGLRAGQLIVVAARPGTGKSALALCAAAGLARHTSVGFFSLEMPSTELMDRLLCAAARVDATRYRDGRIAEDELARLGAAADRLYKLPMLVDDTAGLRMSQLRARCLVAKARPAGLGAVIVDYLQLLHGDGRFASREAEVSAVARGLKELAKELSVPIVALAQMSRGVEQRGKDARPRLSDLRESGEIENAADVVAFLHREKDAAETTLIVEKQRGGPTGDVRLLYQQQYTRFVSYQEEHTSE